MSRDHFDRLVRWVREHGNEQTWTDEQAALLYADDEIRRLEAPALPSVSPPLSTSDTPANTIPERGPSL